MECTAQTHSREFPPRYCPDQQTKALRRTALRVFLVAPGRFLVRVPQKNLCIFETITWTKIKYYWAQRNFVAKYKYNEFHPMFDKYFYTIKDIFSSNPAQANKADPVIKMLEHECHSHNGFFQMVRRLEDPGEARVQGIIKDLKSMNPLLYQDRMIDKGIASLVFKLTCEAEFTFSSTIIKSGIDPEWSDTVISGTYDIQLAFRGLPT